MTEITIGILYLATSVLCLRGIVYHHAKSWRSLTWSGSDTFFASTMSLFWPIVGPLVLFDLYRLKYPAKPSRGLISKWHEKDKM